MGFNTSISFKILIILSIMGVMLLPSCNFIKIGLIPNANKYEFDKLAKKDRIYILHIGDEQYLLNNLKIENDFITGKTSPLPADTIYHMNIKGTSLKAFLPKHKQIKKLVHMYVAEFVKNGDSIVIPYSSIKKMEVYSKESNMAATGYLFTGLSIYIVITIGILIVMSFAYGGS